MIKESVNNNSVIKKGKILGYIYQKKTYIVSQEIMISWFYPAGSGYVVQYLPVGGAKVMQITSECLEQRHLLA